MGLLTFLDTSIDKVFAALKSASQNFPQLLITDISPLRIVAADCGDSTTMYKIYDKRDDFDFDIVNFPFLDGDVPRSTSYGV